MARSSQRPRLLWVNQFAVLPRDGGGTRHFELGRELAKRGWDVTIQASDLHLHRRDYMRRTSAADRSPLVEEIEGVTMQWLWSARYRRNDWQRVWNWVTFWWSVVRTGAVLPRPDVVIGSSPQLLAAAAALRVARRYRVPFVFEVRDLWPESLVAVGARRGLAYRLLDRLAWHLYRKADKILVLAEGTRDYLVGRGVPAGKILHVPNGVDVNAIVPDLRTPAARTPGDPAVFVYAGAHGPANGLDSVLDAAEELRGETPVRFLLVGDGPSKAALMNEAARRGLSAVEFMDAVPKTDLVAIFAAADAGLMILREAPLFSFGVSPNKLFDYLAARLPVLCNVPGEVARMLADSGGGIQLDGADGAALADGVRRFAAISQAERDRMGRAGREWVEREHSREVLGDRLHRHLTDLRRDRR